MAQSVVYADLRFAQVPAGRSSPCHVLETALREDEADSPYENVQPGKAPAGPETQGAQPAPGLWYQRRSVPAGLLGACLLLLATLLTLGICYWQVTRRQQEASRAHAAERGHLSEQVSVRDQSLEQTRLELGQTRLELQQTRLQMEQMRLEMGQTQQGLEQTQLQLEQTDLELVQAREELQRAWLEGNSSLRELRHRNAELERVSGVLGMVEKELQDVQGKLNASESTVSSLHTCMQTECCPSGWVLYKGKCLFISSESKTWKDSKTECEWKNAVLLVQEPWVSWELPDFMTAKNAKYWVGGIYYRWQYPIVWLDKHSSKQLYSSYSCGLTDSRKIVGSHCSEKYPWVCEKVPVPSKTTDTWLSRWARG